jgi:hypothetical protein
MLQFCGGGARSVMHGVIAGGLHRLTLLLGWGLQRSSCTCSGSGWRMSGTAAGQDLCRQARAWLSEGTESHQQSSKHCDQASAELTSEFSCPVTANFAQR